MSITILIFIVVVQSHFNDVNQEREIMLDRYVDMMMSEQISRSEIVEIFTCDEVSEKLSEEVIDIIYSSQNKSV